jgi:hypothetical protein
MARKSNKQVNVHPSQQEPTTNPQPSVRLSVPWGAGNVDRGGANVFQSIEGIDGQTIGAFISDRTQLHETFIREEAKTTRLSLIIAAVLFLAACLVVVFAPQGREAAARWVGATMLVIAAGVAGYKRVWGRSKLVSFGADHSIERTHDE